jgi:hypothetical protein
MTLEEFSWLLDTYGTDLRRWPEGHRDAAESLRRTSHEARHKWAAAEALEALFHQDREPSFPPERQAAIVNAALRHIRNASEESFDWRSYFSRRWAFAAAAAVFAGWLAGAVLGPAIQPSSERGISAVSVLLGDEPTSIEAIL